MWHKSQKALPYRAVSAVPVWRESDRMWHSGSCQHGTAGAVSAARHPAPPSSRTASVMLQALRAIRGHPHAARSGARSRPLARQVVRVERGYRRVLMANHAMGRRTSRGRAELGSTHPWAKHAWGKAGQPCQIDTSPRQGQVPSTVPKRYACPRRGPVPPPGASKAGGGFSKRGGYRCAKYKAVWAGNFTAPAGVPVRGEGW